jgi:hypothetical protein
VRLPQSISSWHHRSNARQLQAFAERRKIRANQVASDPETDEGIALVEELEDLAWPSYWRCLIQISCWWLMSGLVGCEGSGIE